jgi:hypothetical protein
MRLKNSLSEPFEYLSRTRICDLGYLREIYAREDGSIGYRCPAEPVDAYFKKGCKTNAPIPLRMWWNGCCPMRDAVNRLPGNGLVRTSKSKARHNWGTAVQ